MGASSMTSSSNSAILGDSVALSEVAAAEVCSLAVVLVFWRSLRMFCEAGELFLWKRVTTSRDFFWGNELVNSS